VSFEKKKKKMDQEKLIENVYKFMIDRSGKNLKKRVPSLETLKKKFLPDSKQYEGKVLVVLNTTLQNERRFVDARAFVIMEDEEFDWWREHDEGEFRIGDEYETFNSILELVYRHPRDIHRLLLIEDLVYDNSDLKNLLAKVRQECIDGHNFLESDEEGEEEHKEDKNPNKKRKL
jgi:hypothetical protein